MRRLTKAIAPSQIAPLCIALFSLAGALHAHAEAPMHTDDAGTLTQGAMKLEGVFSRDDKVRGTDLIFGAGIAPQLEMEVSLARAKDTAMSPSTTFHGRGWGVKWVPIQNETGWSLGARFDLGHTRVRDHATPQRYTERETALTALASYRLANAQVLHLNAGHKTFRSQGTRHRAATWALGYEIPLTEQLQLTSEVYGEQRSRPDKAVGLRYAITDGLKASVAVGRGNGRTFSQAGMAWEF
ncbi:hypothetical protein [Acidovorax sp. RAC01]|uniref:hypothetical protein n=1 Tax=Acidovorax sp. RAC01 TaxID=1842533 RepID=UPI0008590A86|nr:hypothetical protein [Acidovorax sp. RAC01]AOG22531.1 hypothetical protein BSY15_3621 [Acidovorax sp. RAC01]